MPLTFNERITILNNDGHSIQSIAAILDATPAEIAAEERDPATADPTSGGGGGGFTVSALTKRDDLVAIDPSQFDFSVWEAASIQASDPTKPAFMVISGYIDLEADNENLESPYGQIQVYLYESQPIVDALGSLRITQGVSYQMRLIGLGQTNAPVVSAFLPFSVPFFLPAGWWALLVDQAVFAGANITAESADYAIG